MSALALELRDLTAQTTLARPLLLLLSVVSLLLAPTAPSDTSLTIFFLVWFALSTLVAFLEATHRLPSFRLPLAADLLALAVLLIFSPSPAAFWFYYVYVVYAVAVRWHWRPAILLLVAATLGVILRQLLSHPLIAPHPATWIPLLIGTVASGLGAVYLGNTLRRRVTQRQFLARLTSHLQVEQGIAESVRTFLADLASAYSCELALLAYRDDELERLFVWTARPGPPKAGRITPENLPLERSDALLLTDLHINLCWNSLEGPGHGFGWDRTTHRSVSDLPRVPGPSVKERGFRRLAAVAFDFHHPPRAVGRILLANSARPFRPSDLKSLEGIARHIAPPIETLFLLRHLRARAIDAERSRISRDLHDGILQTLLSITIQLDVLRRHAPQLPGDQLAENVAGLLQTVRSETDELRRMVTDLRPVRVQSADLLDLMQGFAERYRSESALALDLIVQPLDQHVPDRLCRELFQLYREALYNVKKHARASHVVVKVWQDETRVFLLVDDNGQGFSFAGHFSGDELDRLRLGPISIKERTRSVGGVLKIESNPGHGSRLTVEIPFN